MIQILWRNEHAVLVDKPANTLSVPGRFQDDRPILGRLLEDQLKTPIYPVHRLDYEVSGVMIYALSKPAHAELNKGFEKRMIHKTYWAVSGHENPAPAESQVWKRKILRGKKRSYESPVGELAETHAKVLKNEGQELLWELNPVTGRAHQLRLELYLQGFPIKGDALYNSKQSWPFPGIALRAMRLDIPSHYQDKFGIPSVQEVAPWS